MYDKKFPAIYILLTLLSLPVFSQVTVRNNEPGDPIIMGKIIDAETGEPVEFATISILLIYYLDNKDIWSYNKPYNIKPY